MESFNIFFMESCFGPLVWKRKLKNSKEKILNVKMELFHQKVMLDICLLSFAYKIDFIDPSKKVWYYTTPLSSNHFPSPSAARELLASKGSL